MRKKAGGVPTARGDGKSKLTGSAKRRPRPCQSGGENTPGPSRPQRGPPRGQAPASTSEMATCSASELKRNCDQHNKSKDQERHQASHCQSGTIASDQFRHFSPPSSPAKRRRSGGSSPRAAPALPKPGGIDTPGPAQPSFNARTLSRIEEKLARARGRSPRAARRRGEAECATTPGLAKRTDCVRAHWLMEQRAARLARSGPRKSSCCPRVRGLPTTRQRR